LLPADRIQVLVVGDEAVPAWIGGADYPWLRALIEDFARLDGRPYREVVAFLQEPPRTSSPPGKRRMAVWKLLDLCTRQGPPFDAGELRGAIAVAAQEARDADRFDRAAVLADCARRFVLPAEEIEKQLYADLPGERHLRVPDPLPDPRMLASGTNLALAQGLLRLASEVTLDLCGCARAVVRQVRLRRLLCLIRRAQPSGVHLEISGPFSLFRHTTMYGRALASILPALPWCERFELVARCMLRGRILTVRLRPGDPIAAGDPPRTYDSRLEERFAREFARATLDWDLTREPEPVEAGNSLVFPDFAVVHRRDRTRRFLLEIVGFWTPEYLRAKLDHLRAMPHVPLVLCIDRGLNCSVGDFPLQAHIVWFQKRIEPEAVLAAIETAAPATATCLERLGLGDLFIDWAGRHPATAQLHRRLAAIETGTSVALRRDGNQITIEAGGDRIAVLSRTGSARWGPKLDGIISATLVGKVERHASQSPPQWRDGLQCDRWTVPIVEVVRAASAADLAQPRV
jgi:hypothetical protein